MALQLTTATDKDENNLTNSDLLIQYLDWFDWFVRRHPFQGLPWVTAMKLVLKNLPQLRILGHISVPKLVDFSHVALKSPGTTEPKTIFHQPGSIPLVSGKKIHRGNVTGATRLILSARTLFSCWRHNSCLSSCAPMAACHKPIAASSTRGSPDPLFVRELQKRNTR